MKQQETGVYVVSTVERIKRDRDALLEAAKKALTCASLDSSVRALIQAAVAQAQEKGG